MRKWSMSVGVLLKQSWQGMAKPAKYQEHQGEHCTSAQPPVHESKQCWSPHCHSFTALSICNYWLGAAWPHLFQQHEHTQVSHLMLYTYQFSHVIYTAIDWDRELAFVNITQDHTHVHFLTEGPLSACPPQRDLQSWRHNFNTLTHLSDGTPPHPRG